MLDCENGKHQRQPKKERCVEPDDNSFFDKSEIEQSKLPRSDRGVGGKKQV